MNEEQALRLLVTSGIIGFVAALLPRRKRRASGDESGERAVNVGRRRWCPRWPGSKEHGREASARPDVGERPSQSGDHKSGVGGDKSTLQSSREPAGGSTVRDGVTEDVLTGVCQVLHECVPLGERGAIRGTVQRLDGVEELSGRKDA